MTQRRRNRAAIVRRAALLAGVALSVSAAASAMAFEVQSPAFPRHGDVPARYTCDGGDRSPALRWTDPPAGTKSLALVVEDPDAPAGTWTHWIVYGMPASARELPEGVPARDTVAGVGRQGMNDFHKVGYGGPCPPRGPAHRYVFRLYALDADPALPPRRTKADLLEAIEAHVVAQAELVGRYRRR